MLNYLKSAPINLEHAVNCQWLRRNFEGREAIYIEKGALRVRVSNIQANPRERWIEAEVEEIFTPGLGVGLFHQSWRRFNEAGPLRWKIGGGYLTTFSEHTWSMGYGGWSLLFATSVVQGVLDLCAYWPDGLGADDRYIEILRCLEDHDAHKSARRVFPD